MLKRSTNERRVEIIQRARLDANAIQFKKSMEYNNEPRLSINQKSVGRMFRND